MVWCMVCLHGMLHGMVHSVLHGTCRMGLAGLGYQPKMTAIVTFKRKNEPISTTETKNTMATVGSTVCLET